MPLDVYAHYTAYLHLFPCMTSVFQEECKCKKQTIRKECKERWGVKVRENWGKIYLKHVETLYGLKDFTDR